MSFLLDELSDIPIYEQLVRMITRKIATGELERNESLMSAKQLADLLDINIHTVNKAYRQLATEGLIVMTKKRGAFVHPDPKKRTLEPSCDIYQKLSDTIIKASAYGVTEEDIEEAIRSIYREMNSKEGHSDEMV